MKEVMETMIEVLLVIQGYKLLMPFVASVISPARMDKAADYISKTERKLPVKEIIKWFLELMKTHKRKKKEGKKGIN